MYKKRILVLVFAILIYAFSMLLYNKYNSSNNYISVLVTKSDLKRGEKIDITKLEKIKIEKKLASSINYISEAEISDNSYSSYDLKKGKIILIDDVSKKESMVISDKVKEYISLKIENVEDFLSYQVGKGDLINIYFTYKNTDIKNIDLGTNVYSNENGYTTIKVLENISIENIYDKYGKNVERNKTVDNMPDNIMIKVDKDMAIKLKNIKNLGKFSITV